MTAPTPTPPTTPHVGSASPWNAPLILPEPYQGLLDSFITYVSLSRTKETQRCWRAKLRPLFKAWSEEGRLPPDWNLLAFEKWLGAKQAGGLSARSVQMTLSACNMFIAWATERNLGIPNFTQGIKRPKVDEAEAEFFAKEEIAAVLDACPGTRFEVVFALAALGGFRKTDALPPEHAHVCNAPSSTT